jgi:hypothetical protein
MPEKDVEVERVVQSAILDAIKTRIANLNVVSALADATDLYGKNTPGDAYAKNQALTNIGDIKTLPAFDVQTPVVRSE